LPEKAKGGQFARPLLFHPGTRGQKKETKKETKKSNAVAQPASNPFGL
jgi:hypothetical protein